MRCAAARPGRGVAQLKRVGRARLRVVVLLAERRVAGDRHQAQPGVARVGGQRLHPDRRVVDLRVLLLHPDGHAVVAEADVVHQRVAHRPAVADRQVLAAAIDVVAEPGHGREAGAGERLEQPPIGEAVPRRPARGVRKRVIDPHVELIDVVGAGRRRDVVRERRAAVRQRIERGDGRADRAEEERRDALPGNGWRENGSTGGVKSDCEKSPCRSASVGTFVTRVIPSRSRVLS